MQVRRRKLRCSTPGYYCRSTRSTSVSGSYQAQARGPWIAESRHCPDLAIWVQARTGNSPNNADECALPLNCRIGTRFEALVAKFVETPQNVDRLLPIEALQHHQMTPLSAIEITTFQLFCLAFASAAAIAFLACSSVPL